MTTLNFKPQFAAAIRDGRKRQTIRPYGKRSIRPGDTLHLYTGLRSRKSERLGVATCTEKLQVRIDPVKRRVHLETGCNRAGVRTLTLLSPEQADKLAKADGFGMPDEFFGFFEQTYGRSVFYGHLYRWRENHEQ
jgi:hypothetical protein